MPAQAKEDAIYAFLCARNCMLYEKDPGPALLNLGSADEPRLVPRDEAWQHAYAMRVLVNCDGEHARLIAAGRQVRDDLARQAPPPGSPHAQALSRAADLCDQSDISSARRLVSTAWARSRSE